MNTIRTILSRFAPFAVFYLICETLLRIMFFARAETDVDFPFQTVARVFALGAVFDAAVLSGMLAVFLFFFLWLPVSKQGEKTDRRLAYAQFYLFAVFLLLTSVSEWLFWDEFSARFNFIAVDYLVYTQEVIGNIRESYPLPGLLAALALAALLALFAFRRWLSNSVRQQPVDVLSRVYLFAGGIIFSVLIIGTLPHDLADDPSNQLATEVTLNGIHSFVYAYNHNELDYAQYYKNVTSTQMLTSIRRLLNEEPEDSHFLSSDPWDIAREVRHQGAENHKNVILVTMESMSGNYMQRFGNPRQLTPNLDRLSHEGLFFTELYATGTRTIRGLEAITLSVPPTPGQSIIRRPGNEDLFSLGFVFQDRGYKTQFVYGGYGVFDNMNYFFAHNGFDVVDRTDMDDSEKTFGNIWGVCDEDLFHKVVTLADQSHASGKPFFQLVMTTSNHRPYTYPDNRIDIPSHTGREGGVKYADYAVGQLIEEARKHPWFKDTVFVFVADHTAGSAGKLDLSPDKYHIPLIFYAPGFIKPQEFTHVASQIDIAPVLLGLLNFSYNTKFYGEDVLDDDDEVPHAFISNYQKVGLIRNGQLTVLEPGHKVNAYAGDKTLSEKETNVGATYDAISYYQFASGWKERMKRIPSVITH